MRSGDLPINVEIDENSIFVHFDKIPIEVRARMLPTITALTAQLLRGVRTAEPMKTGQLRAATRSYVDQGPTYIRGKVRIGPEPGKGGRGSNFFHNIAAGALEYGVHANERVAQHRVFERKANEFVIVNAYTRRVDIAARRFLRDPFSRLRPFAIASLRAALTDGEL
jgi:hypothetical protein